jgi:hypothetical protein
MGFLVAVRERMSSSRSNDRHDAERDAETEIARNLWKQYRLLTPTSPGRSRWDWVLVVLVAFTSLQIPFVLVFNMPDDTRKAVKISDYVIDVFFWVDIVLQLNTAFYVEETLVTSRKEILRHCLTSALFWIDVVSTFPWDDLSGDKGDPSQFTGCLRDQYAGGIEDGNLRVLRLLRLLRCALLARSSTCAAASSVRALVDNAPLNPSGASRACPLRLRRVINKLSTLKGGVKLRFFILVSAWFLISHWTACLWWAIGTMEYQAAEKRCAPGAGGLTPRMHAILATRSGGGNACVAVHAWSGVARGTAHREVRTLVPRRRCTGSATVTRRRTSRRGWCASRRRAPKTRASRRRSSARASRLASTRAPTHARASHAWPIPRATTTTSTRTSRSPARTRCGTSGSPPSTGRSPCS